MKKRGSTIFLSLMLIAALSISLIPIYPDTNSYAETTLPQADFVVPVTPLTEVPDGYTGIYTKEDLDNIRNNLSGNYILMNDIEFATTDFQSTGAYYNAGECWTPIGKEEDPFNGVFDGNGYQIYGLKQNPQIKNDWTVLGGLFGYSSSASTIRNLAVSAAYIKTTKVSAQSIIGGVIGVNQGVIDNCTFTGGINTIIKSMDGNAVGGIAATSDGQISNCINDAQITAQGGNAAPYAYIGGIVGRQGSATAITNCRNNGDVTLTGNDDTGGHVGGIAGSSGAIDNCMNTGQITTEATDVAGLNASGIGEGSNVTNCFNTGKIVAKALLGDSGDTVSYFAYAAGIGGRSVSNCYNTGAVTASAPNNKAWAGGITSTLNDSCTDCYSQGAISGYYAGGITGTKTSAATVTTSYYLQTSVTGTIKNSSGTALAATQMATAASYIGFDFTNTWVMHSVLKLPTLKSNPPIIVTSISFGAASYNVAKGGTLKLSPLIIPSNADSKITYKSTNTAVATISTTGTVTGLGLGSTTVTVTDGNTGMSAACVIYVRQGIDTLKVSGAATVDVGSTTTLSTAITPTTPYDNTILWKSSDETVATVSNTGVVTGIKAGFATIYASAKLGTPATQNVAHQIQVIQHPVSIEMDTSLLELAVGESQNLTPTVLPEDTTNKTVTWSSSDENVATVSDDGLVTAISRGEATITAKTVDGALEATCAVNSIQPVESVWITYDSLPLAEYTIAQGNSIQFISDINPDNANNQGITWYTSNPSVATVDGTGYVTANADGTAIITIVSDDGNKVDTCMIYVNDTKTSELSILSTELMEGQLIDFTQTELAAPSLASFMAVDKLSKGFALIDPAPVQLSKPQWNTSDPTIATVDKFGYVHAIGAGPVTITAYATDSGRVTASKEVTIIRDFSITYKLNGGTNPSGAPATYTYATGCSLLKPTRTGYSFGGWYDSANFSDSPVSAISTTDKGDKVLYAKWIPNTYTIKFNDNGVTTGSMANMAMTYDVAKNLTANAYKKTGYSFLGWAKTSTGSVAYKDKASVKNLTATNKATVNLYAKWGASITSAVSYNYNSIKVSWAYAGGATSYKIYRATSSTGTYSLVKTAASTSRSWIDTGRVTGKTYYYKIYPVAGGTTYKFSTTKSAKAIPGTPTVTLTKASSTSIKVTWTGVTGATKYQIYRAGKSSSASTYGDYKLVCTASSTAKSWIDTGRHIGSTYKYKVRAYHVEGTTKVYGGFSEVQYLKF